MLLTLIKLKTFEEPGKVYTEEVVVPQYGCYRVTFKNTAGNGCGNGFWGIKDNKNKTIVSGSSSSNSFRYEFPIELKYSGEGIENVTTVENVNIYPNPANSFINIVAENIANVSVYNSIGQLVYSETIDNDVVKINTESWMNGMYFVNVETADGTKSLHKVVVNK